MTKAEEVADLYRCRRGTEATSIFIAMTPWTQPVDRGGVRLVGDGRHRESELIAARCKKTLTDLHEGLVDPMTEYLRSEG